MKKKLLLTMILSACFAGTGNANTITEVVGLDNGAPTTGPFPNSATAEGMLLTDASAYGPTQLITFENLATGFYSPILNAAPGVTITLDPSTYNYGAGFSGISNTTIGNLYGFNVTTGGANWLGFPGSSATFSFANPSHVFGSYFTGLQTVFGTTLTINFTDGASQTLHIPVASGGGSEYFGFTDTSAFSSVTVTRPGSDAWGMDNVTVAAVPEPETYAMLLAGLGMMGFIVRRKS